MHIRNILSERYASQLELNERSRRRLCDFEKSHTHTNQKIEAMAALNMTTHGNEKADGSFYDSTKFY